MQPRLRYVLVLGALVFTLAIAAFADESNVRIVRLSYVNGQVDLDRDGASGLDSAFLNMPLANGAELVTENDGYAEVEFETGSTVRLVPRGDLHFRRLGLDNGYKVSVLELVDGTAYFDIKHEGRDQFDVLLNGQELRVPKASRFRIVMRPEGAQVSVFNGELRLLGDNEIKVRKNQTLSLDFRGPAQPYLSDSIDALAYDAWNQEREGYTGRYVASGSYLGYSSGFSYGWQDLNYFGSFFDVPGYGSCWRPYGFDSYWDPYMDGAWVWYPGWGYTWVSGYPWGWAPYRYGRWIWAGGYGWVWQPGHSWNSWYAYAPVYNAPHNYHPPAPPPHPPIVASGGPGSGSGIHPTIGGPTGGGSGRGAGIIVVGHGPFTGGSGVVHGIVHGSSASGGAGSQVATGGRVTLPSAITPGVLPNREAVLERLRQVHGQDLGVRGNLGARGQTMTSGGGTAAGAGGNAQTSTGASATAGTSSSGGQQPPKQPAVITMPPQPQVGGSGAANVHEQIQVQQPQVQAQPQHPNPPAIVMPPQPAHHEPPPQQHSAPPPQSPQSSGSSGGGSGSHSNWGGGSSGGSSSGSHGGGYSSGSSSSGSHSSYSGSSSSSGSHSSGGSTSSGSHSSGSHEPK